MNEIVEIWQKAMAREFEINAEVQKALEEWLKENYPDDWANIISKYLSLRIEIRTKKDETI